MGGSENDPESSACEGRCTGGSSILNESSVLTLDTDGRRLIGADVSTGDESEDDDDLCGCRNTSIPGEDGYGA